MLECAIIGDSIAVGVSLKDKTCYREAVGGISSKKFAEMYVKEITANQVLISIGSNDSANMNTYDNMKKIRSRVHASKKVVWLLSYNNKAAKEAAVRVAKENGDAVLEIKDVKDKVHPTNAEYIRLGKTWRS